MSPRTKMFFYAVLIMLVLFLFWSLLPVQVNLGYFIRVFGFLAVIIVIALGLLATRIRRR